ncbi:MAG: helix-turn-helix domain-containing protein [Emcibacter sp.]|nr:helix-turn-helix domain-containing protein [Emcibacter sp.]
MTDTIVSREHTDFLTQTEAGKYLRLSPRTLQNMRVTGDGPVYRKHGRLVFYRLEDLKAWSEASKKENTSDDQ